MEGLKISGFLVSSIANFILTVQEFLIVRLFEFPALKEVSVFQFIVS